ncbi:MAG: glycosyltransferase family 4 protein [bacterium]|nr:glycosyltransferase family 4 protein [bacterium]
MPSPRVLMLHNFMSPYRLPLFAELARRFDFEVWILGDIRRIRDWSGEASGDRFRYRSLPRWTVPLGSKYNVILLNYTLPRDLARHPHDVLLMCGWDAPAMFYGGIRARLRGVPYVVWSLSTPAERTLVRQVTRPAVAQHVKGASAWVASGSRAKEYLVSLGADAPRTHCAQNVVENRVYAEGSRMTPEDRAARRRELGITTPKVLLYCGNLLTLKGVDDLLEAFALFCKDRRDVTLLLVGSGPREPVYRTFCAQHGIEDRVVFTGFVAPDQLPAYYGLSDALVLASRKEVWGLVLNEAMASGLPVVATEVVGAVPELIRHGENGFIAPARDPRALYDTFRRLFDEETDLRAMGEVSRRIVEPITFARMADAFEAAVTDATARA